MHRRKITWEAVGSDIGLGFAALNFMSEHRRTGYMDNTCMADAAPNLPFFCSELSGQSLRPAALGTVSLHSGTDLQCFYRSSSGITKRLCRLKSSWYLYTELLLF